MYGHKNMLFCFKMVKILGTEEIRPSALNSFLNFFFCIPPIEEHGKRAEVHLISPHSHLLSQNKVCLIWSPSSWQ